MAKMASKIFMCLIHVAVIINYALFLRHSRKVDEALNAKIPERASFGGTLKYLTHWNVLLQFAYFIIAFANDIFGTQARTKESSSHMQSVRDFLFSTIAFPVGSFVTIAFWGIYLVDRNLIFPPALDKWFPPITNHMMHTTPLVGQVFEILLAYHIQPKRIIGLSTIVAFGLSYIGWVFYIAYAGGFWVYPVLEHLDDTQRILFILVCAVFMVVLYMIGEGCNYLVWGSTSKDSKSSQGTNIKNRESKKNKVPTNKRKYY